MDFDLQDSIVLLARTPSTLNALLRDLPDTWTNANEGENTWTPVDVVAHCSTPMQSNWKLRAQIILNHGETQTLRSLRSLGSRPRNVRKISARAYSNSKFAQSDRKS